MAIVDRIINMAVLKVRKQLQQKASQMTSRISHKHQILYNEWMLQIKQEWQE